MTKNSRRPDSADDESYKLSILKLARALGRQAAREDYAREQNEWSQKPRKRDVKLPRK
jgi:hypothetical protein